MLITKKDEQFKINTWISHIKYLEKEEQTKPQVIRTKEIIKISTGISEIKIEKQ